MTIPQKLPPTLWPPKTILSDWDDERLARVLIETEDQWINDFIKRLNHAVDRAGPANRKETAPAPHSAHSLSSEGIAHDFKICSFEICNW